MPKGCEANCKNVSLWVVDHFHGAFDKHRPTISGKLDNQRVDPPKALTTDMDFSNAAARMGFQKQAILQVLMGRAWLAESKLPFSDAWRATAMAQLGAVVSMLLSNNTFKAASFPKHTQHVTTTGLLDILYNCHANLQVMMSLFLKEKMPHVPPAMSTALTADPATAPWTASSLVEVCPEAMEVDSPLPAQQAAAGAGGSDTATAQPPLPSSSSSSSSKVKVLPARGDLTYEATASNGAETLFSQLQAHNGSYKPATKDAMAVLGKVEFITNARMQSDEDRGFFVPVNTKATYGTTILDSLGSGAADHADSRLRQEAKAETEANVCRIMGNFNRVPIRDI